MQLLLASSATDLRNKNDRADPKEGKESDRRDGDSSGKKESDGNVHNGDSFGN